MKFIVNDVRRKNATIEMTKEEIIEKYGDAVQLDGTVNRFGKFFLTFTAVAEEKPVTKKKKTTKKKAKPAEDSSPEATTNTED